MIDKKQMTGKLVCNICLPLFILLLIIPRLAKSQDESTLYEQKIVAITGLVEQHLKTYQVPGLSIAIYKDDFVWSRGFGLANLELNVPVTTESVFHIASISKPMVAVAIVKLATEGKINLDDSVQKYVPYYPEKKWKITIRQVLGHLGGISHYKDNMSELTCRKDKHHTTSEALDIFKDWPLVAEPGTKFNYSSYGYNLLGAVIEAVSGKSFAEYMNEEIWLPMGMNHTCVNDPDDIVAGRVGSYIIRDGKMTNDEFLDTSLAFGGGGILSTAQDLVRFARCLDQGIVLSEQQQEQMNNSMLTKDNRLTDYGMGWFTDNFNGRWIIYHEGSHEGTSSLLWRFPWDNFAVAITANMRSYAARRKLAEYVVYEFLGSDKRLVPTCRSKEKEASLFGLWAAWNSGLAYQNRFHTPMTTSPEELSLAFDHFNALLSNDATGLKSVSQIRRDVVSGLHPDYEMFKVGSYIAEKLKERYGNGRLAIYRQANIVSFFSDYIELCHQNNDIPPSLHLSGELEAIVEWADSSWTPELIRLARKAYFANTEEFNELFSDLTKVLHGAQVYPDLSNRMNSYAYYLKRKGEIEKGLDVLLTAVDLYPENANLNDSVGEFYLNLGKYDLSRSFYEKALLIEPGLVSSKKAIIKLNKLQNISN